MCDLFLNCVEQKINDKLNEIHQRFTQPGLQELINTYSNYEYYQRVRNNPELKDLVNKLFSELKSYSDISCANFSGNCQQRVFELVMGDFVRCNGGGLKKPEYKNGCPDWIFEKNGKEYYLECTTRNTSLMNKFCEFVPEFPNYLQVANIFLEKKADLQQNKGLSYDPWYMYWEMIAGFFCEEEWGKVIKILSVDNRDTALNKIKEWVYYTRYAMSYFQSIIPGDIVTKLKNVGFPDSKDCYMDTKKCEANRNFLLDSIARMICDKLAKSYSKKQTLILAVSLALFQDQLIAPGYPVSFDERTAEYLLKKIKENSKSKSEVSTCKLYAIILDTTWYNWFPDVAGTHSTDGYKNYFRIIYNENFIKEHGKLFEENIQPQYQQVISFI